MKPVIAIAPTAGKKELKNYIDWLSFHGFDFKILEKDEDPTKYDSLILTGGADIGKNKDRDEQELKWLIQSYGVIPILGICRGMQLTNIALGGTIYDDLSEELFIKHTSNKELISEEVTTEIPSTWHNVEILNFSVLSKEKNNLNSFLVNSRHHQGVNEISPALIVVAKSTEDGLVEALENKNCLLVQWHPERIEAKDKVCSTIVIEWLKYKINENEISKNRWAQIN
jgi:gamma-glutamyl-gamma-aminobutyrate hydrolase PuuD